MKMLLMNFLISLTFSKQIVNPNDDTVAIYKELFTYFQDMFPHTIKLMLIYRCLPLTTVECERLFSEQGRTKTKFRAALGNELRSNLLLLNFNKPKEQDLLIKRAILKWKKKKERYFLDPNEIFEEEF